MAVKTFSKVFNIISVLTLGFALSSCAQTELASHYAKRVWKDQNPSVGKYKVGNPYTIKGKTYYPEERFSFSETGIASWYGPGFNGKKTANGEIYDQYELTAAHKTLQMPSLVRVVNLENGRSIVVRINDRGPYHPGRVIDMSQRGAELLGFKNNGTARVRLEVLEHESRQIAAAAKAGKDTSRIDVASLNRKGRMPIPMNEDFTPPTLAKRGQAVLLDDARALPLPEPSPKPQVLTASNTIVSDQPLDLSIETIEVSELDDLTPQRVAAKTIDTPSTEMDFLNQLDFMKESGIQGHSDRGRFVPDPVVTQTAVRASNLYVQAGSFGSYQNAEALATKLSDIGVVNVTPVQVADAQYYRVRIGPIEQVRDADVALAKVIKAGQKDAQIIVD